MFKVLFAFNALLGIWLQVLIGSRAGEAMENILESGAADFIGYVTVSIQQFWYLVLVEIMVAPVMFASLLMVLL